MAVVETPAEVVIISNGPGELAAWVRPVVAHLRQHRPDLQVTVALVPCPYASGNEAKTVAAWPDAPAVWAPRASLRYALTGQRPPPHVPSKRGVVLFLGGDQFYGVALSQRLGYPLLVYTETAGRWPRWVGRFLVADAATERRLTERGIAPEKVQLVGNLMVDAIRPDAEPAAWRKRLGLAPDLPVVALLPGSKPFKVRGVTPLFLQAADALAARFPGLQLVLPRSPFTPLAELAEAAGNPWWRSLTGGVVAELVSEPQADWLVTAAGTHVRVLPPENHPHSLCIADVALAVPGTSTAELAVLGVPMVVALPLHKPEAIPLDGLLGRLAATPVLGPYLMRWMAARVIAQQPLVALPNQRAGRRLTPELIGVFSGLDLAQVAGDCLADTVGRAAIADGLRAVMGPGGAAGAVVRAIAEALESPNGQNAG